MGDKNLVVRTDYGLTDKAAQIDALRILGDGKGVEAAREDQILGLNPQRLNSLYEF